MQLTNILNLSPIALHRKIKLNCFNRKLVKSIIASDKPLFLMDNNILAHHLISHDFVSFV